MLGCHHSCDVEKLIFFKSHHFESETETESSKMKSIQALAECVCALWAFNLNIIFDISIHEKHAPIRNDVIECRLDSVSQQPSAEIIFPLGNIWKTFIASNQSCGTFCEMEFSPMSSSNRRFDVLFYSPVFFWRDDIWRCQTFLPMLFHANQ